MVAFLIYKLRKGHDTLLIVVSSVPMNKTNEFTARKCEQQLGRKSVNLIKITQSEDMFWKINPKKDTIEADFRHFCLCLHFHSSELRIK